MIEANTTKYQYQTVENDLLNVKMYTLSNGMRLFMSVNELEPRITTQIIVRAGSKQDPPETTGLAHYMEHMLFKGTSRIGASNWEEEKVLLEQISDLYEAYRATKDQTERQRIYKEIDRISFEAAKLVAPNEYDKLASSIGAKNTNAYTWVEQTVYLNDIPSNELEKWMRLESERFRMMALRLFHTELETVYEEFNINQDRDFRKVNQTVRAELFPNHPYGTQTTIGSAEHLRNPSQKNIQRYFQTYYVPNNMGIVLTGNFDPDQVVELAERYFGQYEAKPIPPFTFNQQPPIDQPIIREVYGQEAPYVVIAWRLNGSQTNDPLYLSLIQHMLYNHQAGILDIHLNQQQKVLEAEAWSWFYEDYSVFGLYGKARNGQSLEEVTELLLQELEKLKTGNFEDWLIEACISDFRLHDTRSSESNQARADLITQSFILGVDWDRFTHRIDWLEQRTKEEIVEYARRHFNQNHVIVYKLQGEDKGVIKVEKPPITHVDLQRDQVSEFATEFLSIPSPRLKAEFINFEEKIQQEVIQDQLHLDYVYNPKNELFQLNYIFEMGKNSDRKLSLALKYLPYLGTSKFSPSELQQEFFKRGLQFEVHCNNNRSYVTLRGLAESLEEGIKLFEHILADVQPNATAWQNVISDVLTKRMNAKQNRGVILRDALANYARYGAKSPFTWRLSEAELRQVEPKELIDRIRELIRFEHTVYYYGQLPKEEVAALLRKYHPMNPKPKAVMPAETFFQNPTLENRVYFLDFPIVQADVLMISRGTPYFNLEEYLYQELYNNYFGYGLSSIVFQEIREAKALAYSTYAYYSSANKKDKAHYLQAYVGTQPDKLPDAIPAMMRIINQMPLSIGQFQHAKEAILRRFESERILPKRYYWQARAFRDLGFERDLRRDVYETTATIQAEDLVRFQQKYVKDRHFNMVVLGSKDQVNLDYLRSFGTLEVLTMEQVFGY